MWLDKVINFLDKAGNKLQEMDAEKKEADKEVLYTCKDTERFAHNFKFDVSHDCIPGNILYFNDHVSRFEILSDINLMNEYLKQARSIGNIRKKYEICVDEISFDGPNASYIEVCPYTNTGKFSKYPIIVHYFTPNYDLFDAPDNYFGHISYFEDGTIGAATLINWIGKTMLQVDLKTVGRELVISKIITINAKGIKAEVYNINKK